MGHSLNSLKCKSLRANVSIETMGLAVSERSLNTKYNCTSIIAGYKAVSMMLGAHWLTAAKKQGQNENKK